MTLLEGYEGAKSLLRYDKESGVFYWTQQRQWVKPGFSAGTITKDGYLRITVLGKNILAHRLAWFFVYGNIPELEVDHIDGNPSNNIISNLRLATKNQNQKNRKINYNSSTGVKGVGYCHRKKRYIVRGMINGKQNYLGSYEKIEDAKDAYMRFAETNHEDFLRRTE